jgi:hypothetical protein
LKNKGIGPKNVKKKKISGFYNTGFRLWLLIRYLCVSTLRVRERERVRVRVRERERGTILATTKKHLFMLMKGFVVPTH